MIAIAPSHKNQLSNYTGWLKRHGLRHFVLGKDEELGEASMLMLCGGPDVGKEPDRDQRESAWFRSAYGRIPVIGICRGLQISNVLLGGSLVQDLSEEGVKHTSNRKQIAGEPNPLLESSWHDVTIGEERIRVNSRHHQGIERLGEGLSVLGTCPVDGLPEIVSGDRALFVQWHPEREDVMGTDAERIVLEWIRENTSPLSDLEAIVSYARQKGYTIVSIEKLLERACPGSSEDEMVSLVQQNIGKLSLVRDRKGRKSIRIC